MMNERWNEENNKEIERIIDFYKGTTIANELKFMYDTGCSYMYMADFLDNNDVEHHLDIA